jgi:UDP-N-acetylmuramoylalanine--D-glutamate ligase
VIQASEIAEDGDIILLSPASEDSSSFNGYQNRGEMFRQIVERLAGCNSSERSTGKAFSASEISNVMSR